MSCSGRSGLWLLLQEHERVVADFPEDSANRRAHEHIAQEVHAENYPGGSNQHCNGEQGSQKLRIEEADGYRDCECGDRVA